MMRPRFRNKLPIFLLLPSFSLSASLAWSQTADQGDAAARTVDGSALRFSSRSDENAPADLKELRWMLSQIETEKGKKDPLADYVEKPSSLEERAKRSEWKEDDEAHVTPKLFKPSANDVPILKRAPISAKLVSSNSNRTSLQPEIPFSSQPATLPGLGGQNPPTFGGPSPGMANPGMANPGMPNPGMVNPGMVNPGMANPVLPNAGFGGAAATVPSYNPSMGSSMPYSSPSTVA
nr:hypothetical protein [Pirellula sp.]